MTDRIRLGTSGWSYDDWVGPFYPKGTAKADYLAAAIRQIAARTAVVVFVNNPYAGHAPETCRQLQSVIDREE